MDNNVFMVYSPRGLLVNLCLDAAWNRLYQILVHSTPAVAGHLVSTTQLSSP